MHFEDPAHSFLQYGPSSRQITYTSHPERMITYKKPNTRTPNDKRFSSWVDAATPRLSIKEMDSTFGK